MEKVLDLFNRTSRSVYMNVKGMLKRRYSATTHYQSLLLSLDNKKKGVYVKYPIPVAASNFSRGRCCLRLIIILINSKEERNKIYSLPSSWRRSKVGTYVFRVVKHRLRRAQKKAGMLAVKHLRNIYRELKDFFIQRAVYSL